MGGIKKDYTNQIIDNILNENADWDESADWFKDGDDKELMNWWNSLVNSEEE